MKIALKYGLLITAVLIAWVLIVRFGLGVGPDSKANVLAPILFNVTAIVAIFLGRTPASANLTAGSDSRTA